jgi:hypothetical protein
MLWGMALVSAASLNAGAQVCVGTPSYAVGRMRAGVDVGRTDGSSQVGAEFAMGHATGGFVRGSVTAHDYERSDAGSSSFGIDAGYAVDMNPKKTAQFCPLAGYTYSRGPDVGNLTVRTHALSVGGSIGGSATINPTADALPFFSAVLVHDRTNVHAPSTPHVVAEDNYGVWTAGVGLVFNRTFTLQPAISRAFNVRDAATMYSLGFSVNFGEAARR